MSCQSQGLKVTGCHFTMLSWQNLRVNKGEGWVCCPRSPRQQFTDCKMHGITVAEEAAGSKQKVLVRKAGFGHSLRQDS